jgi:hypothetical protein
MPLVDLFVHLPLSTIYIPISCSRQGNLCKLDITTGCMDPNSHNYDPLAVVDDGSCPLESDTEE